MGARGAVLSCPGQVVGKDTNEILKQFLNEYKPELVPSYVPQRRLKHNPKTTVCSSWHVRFHLRLTKQGTTAITKYVDKKSVQSMSVNRYTGVIRQNGKSLGRAATLAKYSKIKRFEFLKHMLEIDSYGRRGTAGFLNTAKLTSAAPRIQDFLRETSCYSAFKTWCGHSFPKQIITKFAFGTICFLLYHYSKEELDRFKDSILFDKSPAYVHEHLRLYAKMGLKPRLFYKTELSLGNDHANIADRVALRDLHDFTVHEVYPETLEAPPLKVKRINSREDLVKEGREMKHCVASYGNAIDSGRCAIYSLEFKEERATLELCYTSKGFSMRQLRTTYNKPVSQEFRTKVESAIKQLPLPHNPPKKTALHNDTFFMEEDVVELPF